MQRPARPLNARLTIVPSGAVRASASAQAGKIPASGHRKKTGADLHGARPQQQRRRRPPPRSQSRPSPPRESQPRSRSPEAARTTPPVPASGRAGSKQPRCPPASTPCATIASAPAAAACRASATLVTLAHQEMPRSFSRKANLAEYSPMIDDTTAGRAASTASHCAAKSGGHRIPGRGRHHRAPLRQKRPDRRLAPPHRAQAPHPGSTD